MHFDSTYFDQPYSAKTVKVQTWLNRFLYRMGMMAKVEPLFSHSTHMVSSLQKINFFHLLNEVLFHNIPGDVVELGCFEGQTAVSFARILSANHSDKKLILFDSFEHNLGLDGSIQNRLKKNINSKGLPEPKIVAGDVFKTVPVSLPDKIAFAHIDLGVGGNRDLHKELITHALRSVYEKMSPGAICVLMDYFIPGVTIEGYDSNPGTRMASDAFLSDKPEKIFTLPGGEFSHGFFRKSLINSKP